MTPLMYLKLGAVALFISFIGGIIYKYHINPMNKLERRVSDLEAIVKAKDNKITKLDNELSVCKEKSKNESFENFIEGMSYEVNSTDFPQFTF